MIFVGKGNYAQLLTPYMAISVALALEHFPAKRLIALWAWAGLITLWGRMFPCSELNVYSFVLLKLQWPSSMPPAFCVSDPMGEDTFHCSMKRGLCSHSPFWAANWMRWPPGPTCCKGLDLAHSLSPPTVSQCCTAWAWCACCLFSVTLNHRLISSLGGTYLPFKLHCSAWTPSEHWNTFSFVNGCGIRRKILLQI